MDKRSLLLGLGLGIIIGALLMQLFIMGEMSTNQLLDRDSTINDTNPQIDITPAPVSNITEVAPENSSEPTVAPTPQPDVAEPSPTPVVVEEPNNDINGEYSNTEEFPTILLLRVKAGATVVEVATVLEKNLIVEDADDFIRYTRSQSKQNKLRAGYFYVEKQTSNETILKILTSEPISEDVALEHIKQNEYKLIISPEN